MKMLFSRRANVWDIAGIITALTLASDGLYIAAVAVIVVSSLISVIGENHYGINRS